MGFIRLYQVGFLTLWCPVMQEDFVLKKTDRTWLCTSVTLAPKVVESCSKVQKIR